MAKTRCIICGTWFTPNPRTYEIQKACSDSYRGKDYMKLKVIQACTP